MIGRLVIKGGPGSGHHGHSGRPGKIGGSSARNAYYGVSSASFDEYMAMVHSYPLVDNGAGFMVRDIPHDAPNAKLLQELDNQERSVNEYSDFFNVKDFDDYVNQIEGETKTQLEKSDVFMRITPDNLENALDTGSFENTFTTKNTGAELSVNKTSHAKYMKLRVDGEQEALGVPTDANASDRPIYGYWSQSDSGITSQSDTWLSQYGDVSVKFKKNSIADSLSFTESDSLDDGSRIRSSDWRSPSVLSTHLLLSNVKKGPDAAIYWEAQIYEKSVHNVQHVYSAKPLPALLRSKLDAKGIPWTITE